MSRIWRWLKIGFNWLVLVSCAFITLAQAYLAVVTLIDEPTQLWIEYGEGMPWWACAVWTVFFAWFTKVAWRNMRKVGSHP